MNSIRHALVLSLGLIIAGGVIFFLKVFSLGYPLAPNSTTSVWNFEIYLEFLALDEPARLEVYLPAGDVARTFPQEQFYNGPFGLSLSTEGATRNRKAIWTYRYPSNRKVLRYTAQTIGETVRTPLPEAFRKREPQSDSFEEDAIRRQAFIVWKGNIRRRSADERSYVDLALSEIFQTREEKELYTDELSVLLGEPGIMPKLRLAQFTLEDAGIPARIVNGVYLNENRRRVELRHWLEYHMQDEDFRFFPAGEPSRFFTIWYGSQDLVTASGIDELDVQIALQERLGSSVDIIRRNGGDQLGGVDRLFSFNDLPLTTQLVYRVLITIPVGITILVFLRQFVGVTTLGTFMPVLIGIAFRETALLNGLILFSGLIIIGLALRFYLERLQLLLVPRLGVVVIFIVMAMAAITIALTNTNQAIGLSISLFPIVILTMTIERMSIVWEESSASDAIKQGLGSLIVAAVTYLAMTNDHVEYLMYQYPELLLVLMGLCVLMGRYTGLRLSEFWRFRELAR
ncbi:MAG: UUP1 family membrane protein [Pseudomonadota bacterium]